MHIFTSNVYAYSYLLLNNYFYCQLSILFIYIFNLNILYDLFTQKMINSSIFNLKYFLTFLLLLLLFDWKVSYIECICIYILHMDFLCVFSLTNGLFVFRTIEGIPKSICEENLWIVFSC